MMNAGTARHSITVRNRSGSGMRQQYAILSEVPKVQERDVRVQIYSPFQTPRLLSEAQFTFIFEPGIYFFLGYPSATDVRNGVDILSYCGPIQPASLASDGITFRVSKSKKLEQTQNSALPRHARILVDSFLNESQDTGDFQLIFGVAKRGLATAGILEKPAPVFGFAVWPNSTYTFETSWGIYVNRISAQGLTLPRSDIIRLPSSSRRVIVTDQGDSGFSVGYPDSGVVNGGAAGASTHSFYNPLAAMRFSIPDPHSGVANDTDGGGAASPTQPPYNPLAAMAAARPSQYQPTSRGKARNPFNNRPRSETVDPPSPLSGSADASSSSSETARGPLRPSASLLSSALTSDQIAADDWLESMKKIVESHKLWTIRDKNRIRVAVLDSGIDRSHPDMMDAKTRIADVRSFIKADIKDTDGHGTHIAGIILSLTQNVDLYVAKVTETSKKISQHETEIVAALEWARTKWKVHIISLSFGFDTAVVSIQREIKNCDREDISIFAAASNDGGNAPRKYPASYDPPVICISAATPHGNNWTKNATRVENKDNFMTLGHQVKSAWPLPESEEEEEDDDSEEANPYRYMSGTSFATPIAVSIAALMLGYIHKKIPPPQETGSEWLIRPESPDGLRRILRLLSGSAVRDGFRFISPIWFFERFRSPDKIKADITDLLSNMD